MPVVSEGSTAVPTPSVLPKASTSVDVQSPSDVSATEDFQFEWSQSIETTGTVSDNTPSNSVITNVKSVSEIDSSDVTHPSTSGDLSAEDLPPLELNKCLHISIE